MLECDYLIIGAGLSGLVLSERLCSHGKNVVLIERTKSLGGVLSDRLDRQKKLVPVCGFQYFLFPSEGDNPVRDYFKDYKVDWAKTSNAKGICYNGKFWPVPFSKRTLEILENCRCDEDDYETYKETFRIENDNPSNAEEYALDKYGTDLCEKLIFPALKKKYLCDPNELIVDVIKSEFEEVDKNNIACYPRTSYSKIFERIINRCEDRITIMFNTDYYEIKNAIKANHIIYTGSIDELFSYKEGFLDYLTFQYQEVYEDTKYVQPFAYMIYPDENIGYCSTFEIKHVIGGNKEKTIYSKEFVEKRTVETYPTLANYKTTSNDLYELYKSNIKKLFPPNFHLVGRCGSYIYGTNQEKIIGNVLNWFEEHKLKW